MQKTKRFPFTEIENQIIRESVKRIGEDWEAISKKLPGRTPKQCHDRYINYLRDGLKSEPWSPQEDETLLTMYKAIGPKWSKMMNNLPGRSGNDIKNRWHKHLSKKSNQSFNMNNIYNNSKSTSNLTDLFDDQNFSIFEVPNVRSSNSLTTVMPRISFKVSETLNKKEESFTKTEPEPSFFQQQINQFTYFNDNNYNYDSINFQNQFPSHNIKIKDQSDCTQNTPPVKIINKIDISSINFDHNNSNSQQSNLSNSFGWTDFEIQDFLENLNSIDLDFY